MQPNDKKTVRYGLGSFAYRYAIGFNGFMPPEPMGPLEFIERAGQMDFEGVQLCENLNYSGLSSHELLEIGEIAAQKGLFIELGMKDISLENLERHLEIAGLLSSDFLRVVLGGNRPESDDDPEELFSRAVGNIKKVLPVCKKQKIKIGIENHFDLKTADLVRVVEEIGDEGVGLILDTTNGLGFCEHPFDTLEMMKSHLLSTHIKDYSARKVEAGYLVTGSILGEGWLDVRKILKKAISYTPDMSVIMEMTIRRNEQRTMEETIAWENDAIKKSAVYLKNLINQISKKQSGVKK